MVRNVYGLASLYNVESIDDLPRAVYTYTDYPTYISWDDAGVELTTVCYDADAEFTSAISFPFTDVELYDTISGLQCAADAAFWKSEHDNDR